VNSPVRIGLILTSAFALACPPPALAQAPSQPPGQGQMPPDEEKTTSPAAQRFKALTEAEGLEKKDKEKTRPPYEFYRSQIAPFDVLPFVKPGHWNTLSLEMRANYNDYAGWLQTSPVLLQEAPNAQAYSKIVYRRDAKLQKEQDARLSLQVMLPVPAKEMVLELTRPEAIRADGAWQASLMRLEPHQMIMPILNPEPTAYSPWGRLNAFLPSSGDKEPVAIEKQRYYKLVIPQKPEKPPLSAHPLTWTTTSHVLWDGLVPDALPTQQRAMIDWLHWGGQLIVVGVGPSVAPLQESFLGPYLPASPTGKTRSLGQDELAPMARAYPPPQWPGEWEEAMDFNTQGRLPPRYKAAWPIKPKRPVLFADLEPKPGASTLHLDGPGSPVLAAEWRVGRGRVTMLGFNPVDPAFVADAWPGMDTFVRRVVLRRPEEAAGSTSGSGAGGNHNKLFYQFLNGSELSWVRYLGRDLGAGTAQSGAEPGDLALPIGPVAAWSDTASSLPMDTRKALEEASGISIPASSFVLKVILAYSVALVPLNWLLCRFLLRRRELAWALVPVLALGFAVVVERAAAYDLGFDSACDEIDLLEVHGGYGRGHVNRFAALYSTGRDKYTIAYPNDPTALALPLNMQRALRGEEAAEAVFQSTPEPALAGFQVQPRSLAMFRAEAMVNLGGTIDLIDAEDGKGPRRIANLTNLELHDPVLIEGSGAEAVRTPLATIASGATAEVRPAGAKEKAGSGVNWVKIEPFLEKLRGYTYGRPEDKGEVRLVAWAPGPHPGQSIEPKVDRHRGFRLVVVHLRYGPPPDPSRPPYFSGRVAGPLSTAALAPGGGSPPLPSPHSEVKLP
jgi:hypothetical protein